MRHLLSAIALFLSLAFLVTASPADDADTPPKKDPPSKKDSAAKSKEKPPKEKKGKTDHLSGKLTQVEGAQRYLTLQVTQKVPQENAGAAQNIANYQRQLLTTRDPNSIRSIRLEMMKQQQNLITYKDETKTIELSATDEMKVRTLLPPVEYDDKGKMRKLTEKEKRALKGPDPSLPGYPADFDSLKPGQTVNVYLSKAKNSPKVKFKEKDKDVIDPKDRPRVVMVVIVAEEKK